MKKICLATCIATLFALNVNAQSTGGFVELGAGSTTANLTVPAGYTSSSTLSTKFSPLGGYMLNKNFGFEGGYTDLGKASISTSGAVSGTLYGLPISATGSLTTEGKASGYLLGLRGVLPVSDKFSVAARAGYLKWNTDVTNSAVGTVTYAGTTSPVNGSIKNSITGGDLYWGFRGSYSINPKFAIGLGFANFKLGGDINTTVSATDLFLTYGF